MDKPEKIDKFVETIGEVANKHAKRQWGTNSHPTLQGWKGYIMEFEDEVGNRFKIDERTMNVIWSESK